MPKDTKAIPPPARDSIPSKATRATKLKLDAYTEWLTIVVVGVLIAIDKVPWEVGLGVITLLAGVTGVLRNKGGGTATGLFFVMLKKALVGAGIMALLGGCGTGITAGQAVKTLLPVAAEALRDIAAAKGVTIDESGAACFEAPEIEIDIPELEGVGVVALVCIAPYLEE